MVREFIEHWHLSLKCMTTNQTFAQALGVGYIRLKQISLFLSQQKKPPGERAAFCVGYVVLRMMCEGVNVMRLSMECG